MSDPVTNVEIEDVLTSIRRLVSENGRSHKAPELHDTETDSGDEESQTTAPEGVADRLMLTPALRIPEDDTDSDDGRSDDDSLSAETVETEAHFESVPVEETLENWGYTSSEDEDQAPETEEVAHDQAIASEDGSGESQQDGADDFELLQSGFEPAIADVSESVLPEAENLQFPDEGDETDKPEHGLIDSTADSFDSEDGIALSDARELDSRIVQWGRLGTSAQEPYEPDAPGDSDYAGTDTSQSAWGENVSEAASDVEAENETNSVFGGDGVVDETDLPQETQGDEDGPLPMFIASASRRVFDEETTEQSNLDTDKVEQEVGQEMPVPESALGYIASRIEAETLEGMTGYAEDGLAPELEGFDPEDTAYLDEAMLRDLVGEIVRQELQGALGERITRNVRKLVRREIHRALAAHDLE